MSNVQDARFSFKFAWILENCCCFVYVFLLFFVLFCFVF